MEAILIGEKEASVAVAAAISLLRITGWMHVEAHVHIQCALLRVASTPYGSVPTSTPHSTPSETPSGGLEVGLGVAGVDSRAWESPSHPQHPGSSRGATPRSLGRSLLKKNRRQMSSSLPDLQAVDVAQSGVNSDPRRALSEEDKLTTLVLLAQHVPDCIADGFLLLLFQQHAIASPSLMEAAEL